jgi:hypothetical protein
MPDSLPDKLDGIPLRNVKAAVSAGEGPVQKLNLDAGDVLDLARVAARLEAKQMADVMVISHSLVLRGLKSGDLSFRRLWELDDAFWTELLFAIARKRRVARVRETIEIERVS